MIIGVGVDIIEIKRIEKACQKKSFVEKAFSEAERQLYDLEKYNSLAGNFAVKEAVSKAFGTGFRGFKMTDIEVLRNDDGMPYVKLNNQAEEIANKLGITKIFVSISHNRDNAVGYAIAES